MANAEKNRARYLSAKPFPNIMFDDFLPNQILEKVISEFPSPDANLEWIKHVAKSDDGKIVQINKLGFHDETKLHPVIRQLLWELNSSKFLLFLEKLTGIKNIIPDPHMFGGGIHQSLPGAVLKIHADFNRHPLWKLRRRLNLILFLNKDWKEEYDGDIELWSSDMQRCEQKILPIANRFVLFTLSEKSFHGHPKPLNCPKGMTRKSIAMYYYDSDTVEESESRKTLWQSLPTKN